MGHSLECSDPQASAQHRGANAGRPCTATCAFTVRTKFERACGEGASATPRPSIQPSPLSALLLDRSRIVAVHPNLREFLSNPGFR